MLVREAWAIRVLMGSACGGDGQPTRTVPQIVAAKAKLESGEMGKALSVTLLSGDYPYPPAHYLRTCGTLYQVRRMPSTSPHAACRTPHASIHPSA